MPSIRIAIPNKERLDTTVRIPGCQRRNDPFVERNDPANLGDLRAPGTPTPAPAGPVSRAAHACGEA